LGKLIILMVTAFVDMVGNLMVLPLLPFVAKGFLGRGPLWTALDKIGAGGPGVVVSLLVAMFAVAQLTSAPLWGRFSDRYGRRPALMIGLGASAIAYVLFAFANSLELLFLLRLVQGAGGGTVGVIQAYVADATKPEDRSKALGWLSAATNAGVALGPVLGSTAAHLSDRGPGLAAASLAAINMIFAWSYLRESHDADAVRTAGKKITKSSVAVRRVVSHWKEPASRLIWIYAITMGSFQGMNTVLALFLGAQFGADKTTIGYFFTYVGIIAIVARALLLGPLVDRFGEPRLSRIGMVTLALGLGTMPLAPSIPWLAVSVAMIPLGTAFTFPCVTGLLSRIVPQHERGLYMGVQQTFGGAARSIAPLYAGLAFDYLGHGVPYFTAAGVVLATITLGIGMEKHVPHRSG
jgi:multidrug resistance protein